MAITVAPLTATALSAAPSDQAGIASGVNNAVSRAGGVLAIAIFGALALFLFSNSLDLRATALDLPPEARAALQAEAARRGAAEPPAALNESQAAEVEQQIRVAFVAAFRRIALLAATLAGLSALIAWFTITPDASNNSSRE